MCCAVVGNEALKGLFVMNSYWIPSYWAVLRNSWQPDTKAKKVPVPFRVILLQTSTFVWAGPASTDIRKHPPRSSTLDFSGSRLSSCVSLQTLQVTLTQFRMGAVPSKWGLQIVLVSLGDII